MYELCRHIAFPSSEIFRCLANRTQLLEGILGADLIGFQTYNLSRHFRQTCQRLLSVEATPRGIQLQNGFAKVGVFPIGIDVKALHERKYVPDASDTSLVLADLHLIGVKQEWQSGSIFYETAMQACESSCQETS